jgi:hypothetical protein
MRLRACTGLLLLGLAGCQHLPEGVRVDLVNRVVEVGPCRCKLPAAAPAPEEPAPQPHAAPDAAPEPAGEQPR